MIPKDIWNAPRPAPVQAPKPPPPPAPAAAKPNGIADWLRDLFVPAPKPPTPPPAAPQTVDQNKVDMAVRMVNSSADLVNMLKSPVLNQAERDAVVAQIAKDPDKQMFLYGDSERLPVRDQADIATAVNSAVKSGALTTDDLVKLADFDQSGMGPARLVQMLALDPASCQPGSPMEALGKALWARADQNGPTAEADRAAASLAFCSSPALMEANLTTDQARDTAFTALTNYLDSGKGVPDAMKGLSPELADRYQHLLLASTGRLFIAHGSQIMQDLTRDGNPDGGVTLSRFFADVYLNPASKGIDIDHSHTLTQAIDVALAGAKRDLMTKMNSDDPATRQSAARQLGRIVASVDGGAAIVLGRWRDAKALNQENITLLGDLLGKAAGALMPEGMPLADTIASKTGELIAKMLLKDPSRPDVALGQLYAAYQGQLSQYEQKIGKADLVSSFDGEYAAEDLYIRQQLELNFG